MHLADKPSKPSELHASYRAVFDTADGKRVLNHLCKVGFVNDATYVSGDSHETAHREGMSRVVISILRFIDRDPQEFLNLEKEAIDE